VPYCPKCGSEVDESMVFCPKCGASLKVQQQAAQPMDWREQRRQWREQRRQWRYEHQGEWAEKHEKHEQVFLGPLVAGVVLIVFGLLVYFGVTGMLNWQVLQALFFVLLGLIILVGGAYAYSMRRRYMAKSAQGATS
jgi:hypothetical protein